MGQPWIPQNEIKEDRHRLSKSLPDLKIKIFSKVWNLSGTNETRLTRKHPSMRDGEASP